MNGMMDAIGKNSHQRKTANMLEKLFKLLKMLVEHLVFTHHPGNGNKSWVPKPTVKMSPTYLFGIPIMMVKMISQTGNKLEDGLIQLLNNTPRMFKVGAISTLIKMSLLETAIRQLLMILMRKKAS